MNLHPDTSAQLVAQHRQELHPAAARARLAGAGRPGPLPRWATTLLADWWARRRAAPATPDVVIDLTDRGDLAAAGRRPHRPLDAVEEAAAAEAT